MMEMVCPECKSNNKEFDERMGELVCLDCGLVLVTEAFEQSVSILSSDGEIIRSKNLGLGTSTDGIPRHIKKGISFCNMALTSIAPQIKIKDRIAELYVDLHNKGIFGKSTLEDRASAVVFYALKEHNTPYSMAEVCKEYSCKPKVVNKLVRNINQVYGNKHCYNNNHEFSLSRETSKLGMGLEFSNSARKVLTKLESVIDEAYIPRGKLYYASICWMTALLCNSDLSQAFIAKQTGYSAQNILKKTKQLCRLLGFEKPNDMRGKINEV